MTMRYKLGCDLSYHELHSRHGLVGHSKIDLLASLHQSQSLLARRRFDGNVASSSIIAPIYSSLTSPAADGDRPSRRLFMNF